MGLFPSTPVVQPPTKLAPKLDETATMGYRAVVETKATSTLSTEAMDKQLHDAGLQVSWHIFSTGRNYFGGLLLHENDEAIRRLTFVQLLREQAGGHGTLDS